MTDKDIWRLNRGGHDPHKVYAAYNSAIKNTGSPTVILAKTIKGYGMGKTGESVNTTHQQKKLDEEDLLYYRDRFNVPLTDKQVKNVEYFKPSEDSEEMKYFYIVTALFLQMKYVWFVSIHLLSTITFGVKVGKRKQIRLMIN